MSVIRTELTADAERSHREVRNGTWQPYRKARQSANEKKSLTAKVAKAAKAQKSLTAEDAYDAEENEEQELNRQGAKTPRVLMEKRYPQSLAVTVEKLWILNPAS